MYMSVAFTPVVVNSTTFLPREKKMGENRSDFRHWPLAGLSTQ